MTWDQFWADLLVALQPLVLLAVGAALAYAASWLKARTDAIRLGQAEAVVDRTIDRARQALYAAMRETWQTYVADIKAAAQDGKLSPEEQAEARERALAAFKARLSTESLEALRGVVGDVEEWAAHELEALMPDLKREVADLAAPKSEASASAPSASASQPGAA